MKPAAFRHLSPTSVDEAVGLLTEYADDDAKVIAGGQSLLPLLGLRFAQPGVLVDLDRIDGLAGISAADDGGVTIGAMTRTRALETSELAAARIPLAVDAAPLVAHRAIRNRGTIGGSVAHADPSAELPAVMVALDAKIVAHGPAGAREIAARDFFDGYYTTALDPAEIVTELRIPPSAPGTGTAFLEIARRAGDFAMVGAGVTVTLDGGVCSAARIVLIGVADRPVEPAEAVAAVVGGAVDDASARAAGDAAAAAIEPTGDLHASAAYRRQLTAVLVRRALLRAAERAA